MTSGMTSDYAARRTITAFFDTRSDAEEAMRRLEAAGVARERIRLIPGTERDTDAASPDARSLGDAGAGFWDSLRDLFLPDEDRYTYAEGLRRGGFLVSVNASDAEYERVLDILDDEGTIDIDERAASWRAEGWSGTPSDLPDPAGRSTSPRIRLAPRARPRDPGWARVQWTRPRIAPGRAWVRWRPPRIAPRGARR